MAKLYIGNLDATVTQDDLKGLFREVGSCLFVAIPTDRTTGLPRGFAFVELGSGAECQRAINQFDGSPLNGKTIKVSLAQERDGGHAPRRGWGGR